MQPSHMIRPVFDDPNLVSAAGLVPVLRLAEEDAFYGVRFRGTTFDTGTKLGFLKANIAYGRERMDIHPDIAGQLKAALEG